jgi:hypothetical protein
MLIISYISIISAGEKITPVVTEYTVDTSIYEDVYNFDPASNYARYKMLSSIRYALILTGLDHALEPNPNTGDLRFELVTQAFLKKNSTQIDLFSFSGKCGSINIPSLQDSTFDKAIFSQTFLDNDPGWELLALFNSTLSSKLPHFILFDDDGTEVLSDEGIAKLGFDGQNTYVVKGSMNYGNTIKSWRFRTNINPSGGSLLKKSASTTAPMMMTYGMPDGGYRVTLAPSSGGTTQMQMFDLAGRCLFSKQIENVTRPVSFIVPENNVPQTPFITKVSNSSGAAVKKELIVK